MGRPKAPKRLVLTQQALDCLVRCCEDPAMGMVSTDRSGDRRIALRVDVVLELIRMARFGKGLATLAAKSDEERSEAARRASNARWTARRAARNDANPTDRAPTHDTAHDKSAT